MVYFADILIFIAFVLVIADFFAMSYGVFTTAGAIFFIIGTVLLFSVMHVVPGFFIRIVLPTYAALTAFVSIVIYLAYKAHKTRVKVGEGALVGEVGQIVRDVKIGKEGKMLINGELWTVYSDDEILKGSEAVVINFDGQLRLNVKPFDKNSR